MDEMTEDAESATLAAAGSIKAIDRGVVHQICSGQVVLTLATAVKELLENSIDAGATTVEIRLLDHGSSLVEVTDNGSGVEENNMLGLTLKHHTSKIREFDDLTSVETFGFRGEALSSLCALSDLTISTKHSTASTGTMLVYDHAGHIVTKSLVARSQGTTVSLANLFSTMPVRHREFQRNIKREFSKLVSVVSAYALVSTGVRITCTNQTGKGKKTPVLQTHGKSNVKDNIVAIFGAKQASSLVPFQQLENEDADVALKVEGWVSVPVHGEGRGAPDRQFFFVNNRPCDPVRLTKIVNQVYHGYNRHQFPFVFLNVRTARAKVDVNLTPDKRQVMMQQEKILLECVQTSLEAMYADCPSTLELNTTTIQPKVESLSPACGSSGMKRSFIQSFSRGEVKERSQEKRQKSLSSYFKQIVGPCGDVPDKEEKLEFEDELSTNEDVLSRIKCKPDNLVEDEGNKENYLTLEDESIEEDIVKKDGSYPTSPVASKRLLEPNVSEEDRELEGIKISFDHSAKRIESHSEETYEGVKIAFDHFVSKEESCREETFDGLKISFDHSVKKRAESFADDTGQINYVSDGLKISFHSQPESEVKENTKENCHVDECLTGIIPDTTEAIEVMYEIENPQKFKKKSKKSCSVSFSMESLRQSLDAIKSNADEESKVAMRFKAKIDPNDNESAEEELNKQIRKTDFANMEIFGQFNLGFMIVGLGQDIFIVDQHATDEKYNFETLQRTTHIRSQRMVVPQKLELTVSDEAVLMDNLPVFERNGFQFEVDPEAMSGRRVKISALPSSKNWVFGKEDIEELIFMLSESGHDEDFAALRPSRVRKMFASRACRSSVMIGTALSQSDMVRLIRHMGEIEQPWNCPHGRPTIRHLVNTEMIQPSCTA